MEANQKKKSFVLFADYVTAVSVLTDEQAGRLFKLIFAYVNDMEVSKSQDRRHVRDVPHANRP